MSLVGHEAVRKALRTHDGSFILSGPPGVGRTGIVREWAEDRGTDPAKVLMDADTVRDWTPHLRMLEEGSSVTVVLTSRPLPPPVRSRLPLFSVGYLSDAEVKQILAVSLPGLQPRSVIARLAHGSLADIDLVAKVAETFETFDRSLVDRRCPNLRAVDPLAACVCMRSACATVLGHPPDLPFSDLARSKIPPRQAKSVLSVGLPRSAHEARNAVTLFFSSLR